MLKIVKVACATGIVALGTCAWLPAALAEPPLEARELGRWVPAVGFVVGVAADAIDGDLNTTDVLGPRIAPPVPTETRLIAGSPAAADTTMIVPTFGASIELMTPGWQRLPGAPRGFARVDLAYGFGPEYNVPSIGDPGEFTVSGTPFGVTEGRVLGQGALMAVESDPFVVTVGGGLAFTLDAGGRALRIKPSVEYLRHEYEVSGLLRRAVQVTSPSTELSGFREVTLTASEKRVDHWLGPGVEVDIDATRAGDFVFAPYVALKAWVVLDDSQTVLLDSNQYGETAAWIFRPNRWAFGGTVGVRVRWAPE
jgi:hypothetical protein